MLDPDPYPVPDSMNPDPQHCPKLTKRRTDLIHGRLKVLNVQGVVLLAMHAEILDLVEGNGLVLGGLLVWGLVPLRVGPEQKAKTPFRQTALALLILIR
jgi:hypothetical protein